MRAEDSSRAPFLLNILRSKEEEVAARKAKVPLAQLKSRVRDLPATREFPQAISRGHGEKMAGQTPPIRLIAEIKKASPSKGVLRENLDPQFIAQEYQRAGASAISILTDFPFFQGSLEYLRGAKRWVDLPLLQKDFILQEYQLWEGRAWGADAILLIAVLLEGEMLTDLSHLALDIGLHPLIEVHDLSDLSKALRAKPKMVGINNRNLTTFQVDLSTTLSLIGEIPPPRVVVSESGIFTREEVMRLEVAGLDAVLVGEALMRSEDPGQKVRELLGQG